MGTKAEKNFTMGVCGDNLAWMLDDGILTIVGEGKMKFGNEKPGSIFSSPAPWEEFLPVINSVVIENGVTSIESLAFEGCSNLNNITIPASVRKIGYGSFKDCSGLVSVVIPKGVIYICESAFSGCTRLTRVVIPKSVSMIDDFAFANCTRLTEIEMPYSDTDIGPHAFVNCGLDRFYDAKMDNVNNPMPKSRGSTTQNLMSCVSSELPF